MRRAAFDVEVHAIGSLALHLERGGSDMVEVFGQELGERSVSRTGCRGFLQCADIVGGFRDIREGSWDARHLETSG